MFDSTPSLTHTASAVEALGACQSDIDLLDDASLQGGMRLVREHEQELQRYKLWLVAAIARRSDHTLGYDGLARKNGFPTSATFIQSMTGTSLDEATKLARIGEMAVEAEQTLDMAPDGTGGSGSAGSGSAGSGSRGSGSTALATAAMSGGISIDATDAIRRGLGKPDTSVSAEQLRGAAEKLIAYAQSDSAMGAVTPEALLKRARQARNELDLEAVERGEKQRASMRYVRRWSKDGMSGGSWALPDEDGGAEIDTALRLLLAKTAGGPRFPQTDAAGNPIKKTASAVAIDDRRSADQILADGFVQVFHNGLAADPTIVPGASRAAVRVIVEAAVVENRAGSALLEETLSPISYGKLAEYLCEGGTVDVIFGTDGSLNVGRTQRLFTARQRTALGVRDGGCRFPGCNKPPSWCEAHHVDEWLEHHGATDLANGILLCRYHHMLMHDGGWSIIRDDDGGYWLKPPKVRDPEQGLIAMPSKNPLVAAMKHAEAAQSA
jgi:hypothetical protein